MALTDKNIRFCEEYLKDLNATEAAIRTGYSKKTAAAQASRLLTNVKLQEYIAELKQKRTERTEITADYVLTGIKEVAERCMQRSPVMVFDYSQKALVQKKDEDDNNIWEFDSAGANKAFELLGRHIGLFEKDNNQAKANIIVNIE